MLRPVTAAVARPVTEGVMGGVDYSPAADALFARFTAQPSDTRKGLIDRLLGRLDDDGVLGDLDFLHLLGAHDAQAARQNWIADAYNLAVVGSPAFTVDSGYQGDGSAAYLTTGFIPSSAGGKFTQNAAAYGLWSLTAAASVGGADIDMGCNISGNRADLRVRTPSDLSSWTLNDTTSGTFTRADGTGFYAVIRSGTTRSLRRNKTQIATGTVASTGLPSTGFSILAGGSSSGRSARRLAMDFAGDLDATQCDALHDAVLEYLQAIGAVAV